MANKENNLITSVSQYSTCDRCIRAWWLEKRRKLPTAPKTATVFGAVLHAVLARYYESDDLGRDKTGQPVELYPAGWHISYNKFKPNEVEGEVSLEDQASIKLMVQTAIERGILYKAPGREIEKEFWVTLGEYSGINVILTGSIDLCWDYTIEDHKTVKDMKYAKSANALREDLQMRVYAKVRHDEIVKKGGVCHQIQAVHNIFCKDKEKPQIRKVDVALTSKEWEASWQHIKELSAKMASAAQRITDPFQLPDPLEPAKACNAYGGCPYRTICTGQESVLGYERRIANIIYHSKKGTVMQFATVGFNPNPSSIPQQPPQAFINAPEAAQFQQPLAAPAPVNQDTPPWANPACNACQGTGFNTNGNPCNICNTAAPQQGRPTSLNFDLRANQDGTVTWTGKAGTALAGMSGICRTRMSGADVRVTERTKAAPQTVESAFSAQFQQPAQASISQIPAPTPPPQQLIPAQQQFVPHQQQFIPPQPVVPAPMQQQFIPPQPMQAPQPIPQPVQSPFPAQSNEFFNTQPSEVFNPPQAVSGSAGVPSLTETDIKGIVNGKKEGRPKKGFILLINCAPLRGTGNKDSGRYAYYLDDIFNSLQTKFAEQYGAASYYDIPVFVRRDALAKRAEEIAAYFGTEMVVCTGINNAQSDMRVLVDSLKPLAGMVISGIDC